jgi:hypothetical protein
LQCRCSPLLLAPILRSRASIPGQKRTGVITAGANRSGGNKDRETQRRSVQREDPTAPNFGHNRSSRYWDWNPHSAVAAVRKNHSGALKTTLVPFASCRLASPTARDPPAYGLLDSRLSVQLCAFRGQSSCSHPIDRTAADKAKIGRPPVKIRGGVRDPRRARRVHDIHVALQCRSSGRSCRGKRPSSIKSSWSSTRYGSLTKFGDGLSCGYSGVSSLHASKSLSDRLNRGRSILIEGSNEFVQIRLINCGYRIISIKYHNNILSKIIYSLITRIIAIEQDDLFVNDYFSCISHASHSSLSHTTYVGDSTYPADSRRAGQARLPPRSEGDR